MIKQEFANFKDPCPLKDVKCPTHICHGDKDRDPVASAHYTHKGIAGSELRIIKGGWHILDFHPEYDSLLREQFDFVKKHTPGMSDTSN